MGKTGIEVGAMGFGSAYGTPTKALEMAFERGCNYFNNDAFGWGNEMIKAVKNLCKKGKREDLFLCGTLNWRFAPLLRIAFYRFLKKSGLDYLDALILPWFNSPPSPSYFNLFKELKGKGLVRFFGITGHNRKLFPELASRGTLDLFHCRYNAVHRGAEKDIFPLLDEDPAKRPGVISYTATNWKKLLRPAHIPNGNKTPEGKDCYRFVLSNPNINVCKCGAKNEAETLHALKALEEGPMETEELEWMRRVGDHLYGR